MERKQNRKSIEAIRMLNNTFLEFFQKDRELAGLDQKSITSCMDIADEYLNVFLAEQELEMAAGTSGVQIDSYIGDFLLGYSMIKGEDSADQAAESIQGFYACMLERNLIEKKAYDEVIDTINELSPQWIAKRELFQGGGSLDPFSFL